MTTFAQAAHQLNSNTKTRTTNGMKTRVSSADACVDLFYNIGASRGKDILPAFIAAYDQDKNLALRIAQWARDPRGGSGERQLFRDILMYLDKTNPEDAFKMMKKIPEIGRWDDLLIFEDIQSKELAFGIIADAIKSGNALAAKWTPRKGKVAEELRAFMQLTPKQYRKTLVNLTKVVETQMCANQWDEINFSHVPSVAHANYRKAFDRHTEKYAEYTKALVNGDGSVKINASAIFPYDVLKGVESYTTFTKAEHQSVVAQWDALPNYVGSAKVLPMVDTSGSMMCSVSNSKLTCLKIAISLGLYFATKNTGAFANTALTFSANPRIQILTGDVISKYKQMNTGEVANTNLHRAFDKLLEVAIKGKVPQEETPETLLILSDMQFDQGCDGRDDTAMQMIKHKYKQAGYAVPKIVFWNLHAAYGNTPVKFDKNGTALVSGFSPAIAESILSNDVENFTPENVMLKTVMNPKYDI